jgi:hypothetical protein
MMENKKQSLLNLILAENLSAIVTMANRLKIKPEEVRTLIRELLTKGELEGSLTEDGQRFYKSSITVSTAPVIHRDEKQPDFLAYDTRPGTIVAVIGFSILIIAVAMTAFNASIIMQNLAVMLIFVGLIIFLSGLYLIARRNTPS